MERSYKRDPWALMCVPTSMPCFSLPNVRHHKDEDIRKYRKVCLAFSDTAAQNYVSVAGDAEVSGRPQHDPRAMGDSGESVVELAR